LAIRYEDLLQLAWKLDTRDCKTSKLVSLLLWLMHREISFPGSRNLLMSDEEFRKYQMF